MSRPLSSIEQWALNNIIEGQKQGSTAAFKDAYGSIFQDLNMDFVNGNQLVFYRNYTGTPSMREFRLLKLVIDEITCLNYYLLSQHYIEFAEVKEIPVVKSLPVQFTNDVYLNQEIASCLLVFLASKTNVVKDLSACTTTDTPYSALQYYQNAYIQNHTGKGRAMVLANAFCDIFYDFDFDYDKQELLFRRPNAITNTEKELLKNVITEFVLSAENLIQNGLLQKIESHSINRQTSYFANNTGNPIVDWITLDEHIAQFIENSMNECVLLTDNLI